MTEKPCGLTADVVRRCHAQGGTWTECQGGARAGLDRTGHQLDKQSNGGSIRGCGPFALPWMAENLWSGRTPSPPVTIRNAPEQPCNPFASTSCGFSVAPGGGFLSSRARPNPVPCWGMQKGQNSDGQHHTPSIPQAALSLIGRCGPCDRAPFPVTPAPLDLSHERSRFGARTPEAEPQPGHLPASPEGSPRGGQGVREGEVGRLVLSHLGPSGYALVSELGRRAPLPTRRRIYRMAGGLVSVSRPPRVGRAERV